MTIQIDKKQISYGTLLNRYYDDSTGTVDSQCGKIDFYNNLLNEIGDSLNRGGLPAGKLFSNIPLNIYQLGLDYDKDTTKGLGGNPKTNAFGTTCFGPGNIFIAARYLGDNTLNYQLPASLSHEYGHAHHFFSGWPLDNSWGAEIKKFLEKSFASKYPSGWNVLEAYANIFRYNNGALVTRHQSGPLHNEQVPSELNKPANHPEWAKWIRLLPDLCAFMRQYGCRPGTLGWYAVGPENGGTANGYFQFQLRDSGLWVRQDAPGRWQQYTSPGWGASASWQPSQFAYTPV